MNGPFAARFAPPFPKALPPTLATPGSPLACADEATAALLMLLQGLAPHERIVYLLGGLLSLDNETLAQFLGHTPSHAPDLAEHAHTLFKHALQPPKGRTMSQRLNYMQQSPLLFKKLIEFSTLIKSSGLEEAIHDLVNIRASQLNGCAFCLDMHIKQAHLRGERALRLHHIAIWRESTLFEPRERAALAWTESLTRIAEHGVPDDAYVQALAHFSEKELSDLTFHIMAINAWNRANVAFQTEPGIHDKAFGLDKANLA